SFPPLPPSGSRECHRNPSTNVPPSHSPDCQRDDPVGLCILHEKTSQRTEHLAAVHVAITQVSLPDRARDAYLDGCDVLTLEEHHVLKPDTIHVSKQLRGQPLFFNTA